MKSHTVKLYPTREQSAKLDEWFRIGTGVWNWALGQYLAGPKPFQRTDYMTLCRQTAGHASRVGFNSVALQGLLKDVSRSWSDYRAGLRGKPHRKGVRNRLASLPFRQDVSTGPKAVRIPSLGHIKARGQRRITGTIKTLRLHRRPRGWYCTIVTDAQPASISLVGHEAVGIDLGYSTLATLSTGEKIEHPDEYRRAERRIGGAARGLNRRLLGRLQQRLALARRMRNHAVSRDLVSRFGAIYVSRDNVRGMQKRFGKSVLSAGHGGLTTMIEAKCRQAGRVFVAVPSKNSTRTCSSCGCLDGPTGLRGLRVREWVCSCGERHDRDVNAARNTLILGAVLAHEMTGDGQPEISGHR